MKDAIKTAKENFKNCSWYGDAGQALPARHVAPLFAEINRLRNYLAERDSRISDQNVAIYELEAFKSTYSDMAKASGFNSITDMAVKAKNYKAGLEVMAFMAKEAASLPGSRLDGISGILKAALKQVESKS
jgi:hypothetical protein